ncbi:MAG: bifunctional glutamate N-acetyltransferase/amino-acid acetyltransferase ArgJ [Oscillospiraceae bacterium]
MKVIDGGVTAAKGFEAAGAEAAIKYQNRKDMAMVYSKVPCKAAGTFTTNVVKAAPVLWDRDIVTNSEYAQAVVVNAGIANACTGKQGLDYCRREAEVTGRLLEIPAEAVLVGSTGVIGMQLPMDRIEAGIAKLVEAKSDTLEAGHTAACSIMTTDTISKEIAVSFELDGKEITVGGMSKGSGMIHPNMCTMLAYITTDMAISKELLQEALSTSVADTFNMITVDGDTSTNDTCLVMANGMAGNTEVTQKGEAYDRFFEALNYVCTYLAKKMAGDGEGATKLFEAKVVNARSKEDARTLSRAIVGSNLSKAAIYGCDANFGRFLCAMGYSGAQFDQNDVELFFESENGRLQVFDHGTPIVFDEEKALQIMKADAVTVYVDMHEGEAGATAWGCDLTYDYVKINADYRS